MKVHYRIKNDDGPNCCILAHFAAYFGLSEDQQMKGISRGCKLYFIKVTETAIFNKNGLLSIGSNRLISVTTQRS